MDKSWMRKPRNTTKYLFGLNQFLDFAFASFQRTRQTTPCIQPTPFQAASLPTPSFQRTRQQTTSFQATTLPTPSFQATEQITPSFQPPINPTPAQATSNKRVKRESSHHWTVDGIDSHGDTKRLKLKTREALSLPQGERVVVEFDCLDPIGEAQGLLAGVCGLIFVFIHRWLRQGVNLDEHNFILLHI
uniref:Uncharacterized protein n=1 Tax=Nicotiana tabacum TaxID=4097 RepID=A0A1S4BIA3_TOBAC|nr:PREDICTED: uncharacterized protein LOC107808593 [Nicotiana tabacum]